MREPHVLGRVLVAVASIVAAALLAAPAMSIVAASQEQDPPVTQQAEGTAIDEPEIQPQSTTSPSSSPPSSPASSPTTPTQSQTQQSQTPHSAAGAAIEKPISDTLDKVGQLLNLDGPPGTMDECLIDIGGIGPINICI